MYLGNAEYFCAVCPVGIRSDKFLELESAWWSLRLFVVFCFGEVGSG